MTAAIIALALTVAGLSGAAIAAVWKLGDQKAARVYSDQARIVAMKEVELAHEKVRAMAADKNTALAEAAALKEYLDAIGVDVPTGRGVHELREALRRAAAGSATTAAGAETDIPRVSHEAITPAAAAGGSLAAGRVPGGRG
jgi:hypothetical protein